MTDKPDPGEAPAPRDRKRDAGLIGLGLAAVLLVWFAVDNRSSVPIHFWVHTSKAPLILVVVIAALLGVLIGAFVRRRRKAPSPDGPQD